MRLRALEHVHFLVGQGVAMGEARDQLSAAMKNVSAQTLRDWQERECPRVIPQLGERLQQAHIAGEVFARVGAEAHTASVKRTPIDRRLSSPRPVPRPSGVFFGYVRSRLRPG
jgi:hypothetical protein